MNLNTLIALAGTAMSLVSCGSATLRNADGSAGGSSGNAGSKGTGGSISDGGAGAEREPCYGNGTCNSGLTCASNVCVNLKADSGPDIRTAKDAASGDATKDVSRDTSHDVPPAVWTPASLSGLVFWVAGDKGITSSGTGVSEWADQAGKHNDLGAMGAAQLGSSLNGIPCVAGQNFGSGSVAMGNNPLFVEAVVTTITAGGAVSGRGGSGEFGVNPNSASVGTGNVYYAVARQIGYGLLRAEDTSAAYLAAPHVVGAAYDGSESLTLRVDGVASRAAATAPVTSTGIGSVNFVIDSATVCEMVFVVGTVSPADLAKLESYLQAKYAL